MLDFMVFLLLNIVLAAGTLADINLVCLTAPPRPVEAATAKDKKHNNDYKYGFHDLLLSL
jgi:hypothetical protein